MNHLSQQPSGPAYYIEDSRIYKQLYLQYMNTLPSKILWPSAIPVLITFI